MLAGLHVLQAYMLVGRVSGPMHLSSLHGLLHLDFTTVGFANMDRIQDVKSK